MAITLYQFPGGDGVGSISSPCLKVDLALRLVGVEYELVNVSSPKQARQVSPTGRLPAIEIDGRQISDSTRILDELERRFDAPWLSATEQQQVRDRLWEHLVNDHMYWGGFYLRWVDSIDSPGFIEALFGRMKLPARWIARAIVCPRQRKRAMIHGSGGKTRDEILSELTRGLEMIEIGLEGGPFLQGRDSPGRGDLAIAGLLGQAGYRDTLAEASGRLLARRPIVKQIEGVFEACGAELPRWLERASI